MSEITCTHDHPSSTVSSDASTTEKGWAYVRLTYLRLAVFEKKEIPANLAVSGISPWRMTAGFCPVVIA